MQIDFNHKTYSEWSRDEPETLLRFMAVFAKVENKRRVQRDGRQCEAIHKAPPRLDSMRTKVLLDVAAHPVSSHAERAQRLGSDGNTVENAVSDMRAQGHIQSEGDRLELSKEGKARVAIAEQHHAHRKSRDSSTRLVLADIRDHPVSRVADRAKRTGLTHTNVSDRLANCRDRQEAVCGKRVPGMFGTKEMFLTPKGHERLREAV